MKLFSSWFSKISLIVGIVILIAIGTFFKWHRASVAIVNPTPTSTATTATNEVSFIIGGDMMFARNINAQFHDNFNQAVYGLQGIFDDYDASIINLEGTITDKPIPLNQGTTFKFLFSPSITNTLNYLHINGAGQANNHSDNDGQSGLAITRSALKAAGINPFGGPYDDGVPMVAKFPGNGLTLAVLGINLTFPGTTASAALPVIEQLKKDPTTRVLVFAHWGTEYKKDHTQAQADAAHLWIDAGADLIIGGHPHVIEDSEIYKGVPIIYSLGNLLFDQNWSEVTQEGLIVKGKFTENGLEFSGLPTRSVNYKPALMADEKKTEILNALYGPFQNYLIQENGENIVRILH